METLLIITVLFLAILAIGQLVRVSELSAKFRDKKGHHPSEGENRANSRLMLLFMILFYGFFIWQVVEYGEYALINNSASEHGKKIDALMNFNLVIILLIFFITNTFLFYFAYKYYGKKGRSAYFYPENNKLELVWTVIPAIFLAVIIIYGLITWNNVTDQASENALTVGLYGKQFDWTARYAGEDGELGKTDFNLVSASNPLGIITKENVENQVAALKEEAERYRERLKEKKDIWPEEKLNELEEKLGSVKRQKNRVLELKENNDLSKFTAGYDDKLVKGAFHLPVGREVNFVIRAQDVIHSAFMPHFRAQMNAVPGIKTYFHYTPTITTDSMRAIKDDPEFNYKLLCNKICGAAHYNMKMDIVVDEKEQFWSWLEKQDPFSASLDQKGKKEKATIKEEEKELAAKRE